MGAATIHAMTDRVAQLMEERLGIRGKDLADRLHRGGRLLPRTVRAAAGVLAEAQAMADSPKLSMRIDQAQIAAAYDTCLRHLSSLPAARGWRGHALESLRMIAFGEIGRAHV